MNKQIISNFLEELIQDINMDKLNQSQLSNIQKFFLEFKNGNLEDEDIYKYMVTGWYIHNIIEK